MLIRKRRLRAKKVVSKAPRPLKVYKGRRRLRVSYFRLALFGFILYNLFTLTGQQVQITEMKQEMVSLEVAFNRLRDSNQALKKQIGLLNSDQYIEEIARRELGLVKPGEILYVPGLSFDGEPKEEGEN